MPTLNQHHSQKYVKLLMMGESGSAKTGALAALVNAGYSLAILDFDNGLDVLKSYVRPSLVKNVHYITLQDALEIKSIKSTAASGASAADTLSWSMTSPPTAFARGLRMLNVWKEPASDDGPEINLGKTRDLGEGWFVVIDSITSMGAAALAYTCYANKHDIPWQSDWGEAMNRQEKTTELLCGAGFKANVIVNAHIHQSVGAEGGGDKGQKYPSYLGTKLPPNAPKYFNTVLNMDTVGSGSRVIKTQGVPKMTLKSSAPHALERQYPLELEGGKYAINGLASVVESIKNAMKEQ